MTATTTAPVAAPAPEEPKAPKITQNGVSRPTNGTTTGRVWEIADAVSAGKKEPADRATVLAQVVAEGINPSTGATQYGKWRKFHGLVGAASPGNKAPSKKPEQKVVDTTPATTPPVTEEPAFDGEGELVPTGGAFDGSTQEVVE
jgi:hypothetical protein